MPEVDETDAVRARSGLVLLGTVVASLGVLVVWWASPSPHGYIELFIGLPAIGGGGLALGVGLVRLEAPLLKAAGWLVVTGLVVATALLLSTV